MTAVQVADGVWRLPTAPADLVNSYLLAGADGSLVLLDAGTRRAPGRLLAALAGLGRAPEDVTHLLLSHAHADHTGGAPQAGTPRRRRCGRTSGRRCTSARAACRARTLDPRRRLMARLPGREGASRRSRSTRPSRTATSCRWPAASRVVHTPGHTPGTARSCTRPAGCCITGDAIFNVRGLRYSFTNSCTDVRLSRESAQRLGELDFDVAGFTHGAHVSTGRPGGGAGLPRRAAVVSRSRAPARGPGTSRSRRPTAAAASPGRSPSSYALLATEAKLARKTSAGPPPRHAAGRRVYGRGRRGERPLHLTVLGDSSAAGLGCAARGADARGAARRRHGARPRRARRPRRGRLHRAPVRLARGAGRLRPAPDRWTSP
jgi:glyoxylase-like metal-dependent hydrolase (beta-lactamase superfamily II)